LDLQEKGFPTPLSPPDQKSLIETGQEPHVLVDLTKQQSFESELAESKDDLETVVEKPSPSHPLEDDEYVDSNLSLFFSILIGLVKCVSGVWRKSVYLKSAVAPKSTLQLSFC